MGLGLNENRAAGVCYYGGMLLRKAREYTGLLCCWRGSGVDDSVGGVLGRCG